MNGSLSLLIILTQAAGDIKGTAAARPNARTGPVRPSTQLLGQPLGLFESHGDVGPVERPGRAVYDPQKQEYLIEGAGANMWFGTDEFQFAWKRLKGDFILSAKVEFMGQGVVAHRKIGWMVRSTLDPGSPHASAVVHGDGLTLLQFRRAPGKDTEEVRMAVQAVVIPAKEDFVPYQDYIGSDLEVLDVESGDRTVVYQSPRSLQAPNWTADGKALIYNSEGLLYRFDLAAGAPSVLETGPAKDNNNDHVLSFDGKWIGISHHGWAVHLLQFQPDRLDADLADAVRRKRSRAGHDERPQRLVSPRFARRPPDRLREQYGDLGRPGTSHPAFPPVRTMP